MLHNLQSSTPRKARKRIGRGIGSGYGKTAGKGHKGQLARSGGGTRPGFEGGQLPLFQRLPKRGFKSLNHKEYQLVSLDDLNLFENGQLVDNASLFEKGLIKNLNGLVKVLANGEVQKSLTVKVQKVSQGAKDSIIKAGGTVEGF